MGLPVSALWRKLFPSAAGQCVRAVSLPCSGVVAVGEGSLLGVMAQLGGYRPSLCLTETVLLPRPELCGERCQRSASWTAV